MPITRAISQPSGYPCRPSHRHRRRPWSSATSAAGNGPRLARLPVATDAQDGAGRSSRLPPRLWWVVSQICFFKSLGVCKSLNCSYPIIGFCPYNRKIQTTLFPAATNQRSSMPRASFLLLSPLFSHVRVCRALRRNVCDIGAQPCSKASRHCCASGRAPLASA